MSIERLLKYTHETVNKMGYQYDPQEIREEVVDELKNNEKDIKTNNLDELIINYRTKVFAIFMTYFYMYEYSQLFYNWLQNLNTIDDFTFSCISFTRTDLTFPKLTELGRESFSNSNITSIELPNLTDPDYCDVDAFENCRYLKTMLVTEFLLSEFGDVEYFKKKLGLPLGINIKTV